MFCFTKNYMVHKIISDGFAIDKSVVITIVITAIVFFMEFLLLDVDSPTLSFCLAYDIDFIICFGFFFFVKREKTLFNFYSLFWLSISLFSFGHVILFSLGLNAPIRFIFDDYPLKLVNEYMVFGFVSFVFLFLAGVFVERLKNKDVVELPLSRVGNNAKLVFLSFFVLSSPFYLYKTFHNLTIANAYGYAGIYESEGNLIVTLLAMWYIPSLYGLIYCYKDDFRKFFFLTLLLLPIIVYMIVGGRGIAMSILFSLLYFWNMAIKKITRSQTLIVLLCGLFIMILLPSIGEYRLRMSSMSFTDIFGTYALSGFTEILKSVLGELGGSAKIWMLLQRIIPDLQAYGFGMSYISSVLCCVPSFLFGGFSFAEYANLSDWITTIEGSKYGLGFSMLGESFYNFGWFGMLGTFFVGVFMFYVISCKWLPQSLNQYKYVFSATALYIFALVGRNSIYLGVRQVLYVIIVPALLIYLTRNKKKW